MGLSILERHETRRPFLRWAGSKRKLIPRLRKFWLDDKARYIEPFAGSACLFFSLGPQKAILGDNNAELINLYREVKKAPDEIHRRLVRIPRNSHTYYRWRAKNIAKLDKQTRALRFLYLNHNCFNGIYRTNSAGDFNVPFGSKLARYLTLDEFTACANALRSAKFVSGDFEKTLEDVGAGDFVYLDPPYALDTRRVFREYGEKAFNVQDVSRLATALTSISERGANFVVSYADCPQSRQLAKNWNSSKFSVRRHIAGFSDHRTSAYEWLITNMDTP